MNQELKRIKNKDLSVFDNKIFGSLDKMETINSTLQNLQKFQNFLLTQINQFQNDEKTKNKQVQVKQVISQNCQTLRQSILRAVPNLQSSRAQFKQQILSPNTNKIDHLSKFSKNSIQFSKKSPIFKTNQNQKIIVLIQNLNQVKNNFQEIKTFQKQMHRQLMYQSKKIIQQKLYEILRQNSELKKLNQKIKKQVQQLSFQLKELQKQNKQLKNKECQQISSEQIDQFQLNQSSNIISRVQTNSLRNSPQKTQTENQTQKTSKYHSFMEKMRLDFTAKLEQNSTSFQKSNTKDAKKFNNIKSEQQKFIASDCKKVGFDQFDDQKHIFRSIQLTKVEQQDPNMPKPLRRNSIQLKPNTYSQSSFKTKQRLPLQQKNFFSNQNQQQLLILQKGKNELLARRRSNHDLMRKTKSNFFKKEQDVENIFDSNIVKVKGLEKKPSEFGRRQSSSKQKLKIFSMF